MEATETSRWLATAVERTVLEGHDGRSGASLERVRLADGTRLVVKRTLAPTDLTMRFSGDGTGRELTLWEAGVLDRLPSGVGHAIVGGWRDGDEVVVVMRDLGDAVITWDTPIGRAECRRLFAGAVAAIHDDPGPLAAALAARGTTLVHGDLWVVNAAFEGDGVVPIDWGLATEAPGAFDFATFLMGASHAAVGRDDLLEEVRAANGDSHDETALRLALLASLADLGWNKALDATSDDEVLSAAETAALNWWADQARRALALDLL